MSTNKIALDEYSVVGGFVCYDHRLRAKLTKIVDNLRVGLESGGKPICVLLCGNSGIGKTFFVKEVAAASRAKYVYTDLSRSTNLKADIDQHILETALAHSKSIAFLDEVHTVVGGETAYRFLLQPMSGSELLIDGNAVRLTNLVWFFGTSRATVPSDFQKVLCEERNQSGVDFADRCNRPSQIVLPDVGTPGERIVKAVAMTKAQGRDLEAIEATALFYFGCTKFQSARDMESHVRDAVNSLPTGAKILRLEQVVEGQESEEFHFHYSSALLTLADRLLRIS